MCVSLQAEGLFSYLHMVDYHQEGSSIEKFNKNALNAAQSERSNQVNLFFLHFPNVGVKTMLHTENKHPLCPGSVLKVCAWGG